MPIEGWDNFSKAEQEPGHGVSSVGLHRSQEVLGSCPGREVTHSQRVPELGWKGPEEVEQWSLRLGGG